MKKPWSISTTVRNAERIEPFLRVLSEMEGENFDEKGQVKYQTLLIQHKLYQPVGLPRPLSEYYSISEDKMEYKQAKEIFQLMKDRSTELKNDPGLRGRTSAAPLTKMGLAFARESLGKVRITELGKGFLSGKLDIGEVFFRFLLKWQYPNPDSSDFREIDGFAVKPFIGTLHLINEVNERWIKLKNDSIGISKDELSLFATTLIDCKDIKSQADKLIEYRTQFHLQKNEKDRRVFRNKYRKKFAEAFLGTRDNEIASKFLNNIKDYGDNAIRYFRLTRYLYIRGGGYYLDLEPRRSIEIEKLLSVDNAQPLEFKTGREYLDYLADIKEPVLPWETEKELRRIAEKLYHEIQQYSKQLTSKSIKMPSLVHRDIMKLGVDELKNYNEELRAYRRKLQEIKTHYESQNVCEIEAYIDALENLHQFEGKRSIELEKLTTLALNALNDALEIKPNYPVGDDNEPTFTAPANKPDVECFYEKFNTVCEVTMLTDRSQWYNEGQPVMRHLRDFENIHSDKRSYCLFVAPRLHQDSMETFWMAVKFGYKGIAQRIVPISVSQLIVLLEALLEMKKNGKRFTHDELSRLYDQILQITDSVVNSEEWVEKIPETINLWKSSITSDKSS